MESINVENRSLNSNLHKLRSEGIIPGSLYGPGIENGAVKMKMKDFRKAASKIGHVYQVKTKERKVFVRFGEIQKDPISNKVLHFSLVQLPEGIQNEMNIPLELIGTPVGTKRGGVLVTTKETLSIIGKPIDMPESIKVDVSLLEIGDKITVKDLSIPSKVKSRENLNEVLVILRPPAKIEEPLETEVISQEGETSSDILE